MKKLRITVNNTVYEVTVQVLEDDEARVPGANDAGMLPPLPRVSGSRPAPGPPLSAPASGAPRLKGDPNAIFAPIAGTVQKVFVEAGNRVDAKAPVVLLEAMKMDTYIYAPRDGVVAAVGVASGDAVQVGDTLLRYQPEA